jgi:hypothetical protein
MTEPTTAFIDVSTKVFLVPPQKLKSGLIGALVHERGTRLFGNRMFDAGYKVCEDIHGVSAIELLKVVPTTRKNFDRVVKYFQYAGIRLT